MKSTCEKDLGVYIKNDVLTWTIKWDVQVRNCATKANRVLGMIRKTFKYKNKDIIRLLYTSLVRPHLEYAVSAWCPYFEKDCNELEKVQKRATKLFLN